MIFGKMVWIDEYIAAPQGDGKMAVTAGGFGPIISREAVERGEAGTISNAETGSGVTFAVPPGEESSNKIDITFYCQVPRDPEH
jgi:hypothetical protein